MKTVLATGANGFLARALAISAPGDWRLVGLVRAGAANVADPAWDRVYDSLEALIRVEPEVDVVLHLAAEIPRDQDTFHPNLIAANACLPGQLLTHYPRSRHVLASSVSVYGTPVELPLSIDSPVAPISSYGWSKLAAESLVRTAGSFAILRFSSIIGPGMREGSFIPSIVEAARRGHITLRGDGSRTQDYIDVSDAAKMCVQAAGRTDSFLTLAVSGDAYSNLDVAEQLASITDASIGFHGPDPSPSFRYTLEGAALLGPCSVSLPQSLRAMARP